MPNTAAPVGGRIAIAIEERLISFWEAGMQNVFRTQGILSTSVRDAVIIPVLLSPGGVREARGARPGFNLHESPSYSSPPSIEGDVDRILGLSMSSPEPARRTEGFGRRIIADVSTVSGWPAPPGDSWLAAVSCLPLPMPERWYRYRYRSERQFHSRFPRR